jgi:hypothetical protein
MSARRVPSVCRKLPPHSASGRPYKATGNPFRRAPSPFPPRRRYLRAGRMAIVSGAQSTGGRIGDAITPAVRALVATYTLGTAK